MAKEPVLNGRVFNLSPEAIREGRENTINVQIGDRGEGKTTDLVDIILPIYAKKKMPVNVVLTTRNNIYDRAQGKVNLIYATDFDTIREKVEKDHNCVWVFEDSKTLFDTKLDKPTRTCLINTRMINVDTYFMYQAWGWTCCDVLRVADSFTIYKNVEDPKCRKDYLGQQELEILHKYTPKLKHRESFTIIR